MALSQQTIQAVKERADIVQVIGERVALTPAGGNWKGLCPFHGEKTPSFNVHPGKGIYHCFGCGAGGSVVDFVMAYERLSFPEAIAALAQRVGVPVEGGATARAPDRGLEALEAARRHYHHNLLHRPEAEPARRYLRQRGFDEAVWEAFSLGYALDAWQGFTDFARGEGYDLQTLLGTGLVREGKTGRAYDMLRNRVVFPILDARGRCIAFGGRIIDPADHPKYLNTPETRHYRKSRVLFGLAQARDALRQRKRAVLVEGYLDVMRLHERGFAEAVATCGTALTAEHLDVLERHTDRVLLVFDGDAAGVRAALRSAALFLNRGVEARVVTLPEGLDPDDYVLRHGAEALDRVLEQGNPILEFLVEKMVARHGQGVEGRERAMRELAPLLGDIRRETTRDLTLRHLADLLMVRPEALRERLRPARRGGDGAAAAAPEGPAWSREVRHQRMLLRIVLQERSLLGVARELVRPEELSDDRMRALYERLLKLGDAEFAALEAEELLGLLPRHAAEVRGLLVDSPLHDRDVADWERALLGEAARIKHERKARLVQRLKRHAGTPQEEVLLQELMTLRRELARWQPRRRPLGLAEEPVAPGAAAGPAPGG